MAHSSFSDGKSTCRMRQWRSSWSFLRQQGVDAVIKEPTAWKNMKVYVLNAAAATVRRAHNDRRRTISAKLFTTTCRT